MAEIAFTDTVGAATLSNGLPAPRDRFSGWTPDIEPIGPRVPPLGTGRIVAWNHRTDYIVALEIPEIRNTALEVAVRLKQHLLNGGECTVNTGDLAGRSYTCYLRPGTVPEIRYTDRRRIRYAFAVQLLNQAAAPLLCVYQ